MIILEVKNAGKTYKTEFRTVEAVKGVDLTLKKGDFCCVLGKSGSGKSTLLNMCAGILAVTAGSIILEGENLADLNDDALSYMRNDKIGYVMQGYALLPNLTVRANIQLPYFMYRRAENIDTYTDELLKMVGLEDKADRYPAELSGGEIRRVEIARALINRPSLIIADEPTGELDKITSQAIMQLFQEINAQGTTILMVTHDLDVTAYSRELFTMEDGLLYHGDRISLQMERI